MYKKRSDSSDGLLNENSTPSTPLTPPDNLAPADKGSEESSETQAKSEKGAQYSLQGNSMTAEEQRIVDEAKANGTYLKAPNGKASNLNEKQWIQVRTKAFKDWFGDWENISKYYLIRKAKSVSEALSTISHLFGNPLTNKKFGFVATITKKVRQT